MNDYKIILLGSQCSGKSTLNSYLKKTTNLNSIDHDKEISQRNGGSYPRDHNYVVDEVMPAIEADILKMDKVIYSANYWGLGKDRKIDYSRIERAVQAGFKFIYLQTDRDVLLQRNKDRVANQKYDDASGSVDWYLSVYEEMKEKKYFVYEINTNQPIEKISSSLVIFVENMDCVKNK